MTEGQKPAIAVGYWRTRSGQKAYVAAECPFDGAILSRFVGWARNKPSEPFYCYWNLNGLCSYNNGYDLIEPWREPVRGELEIVVNAEGKFIDFFRNKPPPYLDVRRVRVRYEEIPAGGGE